MKDDVTITFEITTKFNYFLGNTYSFILSYKEKPDKFDDSIKLKSNFLNVFYIIYALPKGQYFSIDRAIMIIEIWICEPIEKSKICYQWRIIDTHMDNIIDRVDTRMVVKNKGNIVQEIKEGSAPNSSLEDFSCLYKKLLNHFKKRVESGILNLFVSSSEASSIFLVFTKNQSPGQKRYILHDRVEAMGLPEAIHIAQAMKG